MSDTVKNGVDKGGVIADVEAYIDWLAEKKGDLPQWMASLSRAIVRDCVAPGKYRVEFTVESGGVRIKTAVISRVEDIRHIGIGGD